MHALIDQTTRAAEKNPERDAPAIHSTRLPCRSEHDIVTGGHPINQAWSPGHK